MININKANTGKTSLALGISLAIGVGVLGASSAHAGRFIFGDTTYPIGYTGEGKTLDIKVCLAPGTPSQVERPLRNAIARWNRLRPASTNIRDAILPNNKIDFESVALHELGHCIGLGHPNVGSAVSGAAVGATAASKGSNNRYDLDPGFDGNYGTDDDVRGDDVNLHLFNRSNNNPFTLPPVIDGTTYSRDLAQLPSGDLFPVNARRGISAQFKSPNSEAVMQHDIYPGQVIRSIGQDDVATVRYAMAGIDETQGTADDYRINLTYGGVNNDCDITLSYDNAETAAASCVVSGQRRNGNRPVYLNKGSLYFNDEVDWFYNQQPPCSLSSPMPTNTWRMVSLPCDVGVSTSAKLRDVFGDDLGVSVFGSRWIVYEFVNGGYRQVQLDDAMQAGVGYWMITRDSGKTIDVQGEYSSTVDAAVSSQKSAGSNWNLIGSPYRTATAWGDTRVVAPNGKVLLLTEADPARNGATACTGSGGATSECLVASIAFRYETATGRYERLTPTSGSLQPFDAAWVFAANADAKVRISMPESERTRR